MADTDPLHLLALDGVACPYCGAQRGVFCRTRTGYTRPAGHRATYLHEDRLSLLRAAWRLGVEEGVRMEKQRAAWQLERAQLVQRRG